MANLSIPTIPSRFLTPVLKFDQHESDAMGAHLAGKNPMREQITESVLVAKVARLTNDGSNVGPGAYNLHEAHLA